MAKLAANAAPSRGAPRAASERRRDGDPPGPRRARHTRPAAAAVRWAAAAVGGWVFMVALAVHAYAVGGAAAVGLAALVRMAPGGPRRAADRASPPIASRAATCCSPRRAVRALLLGRGRARVARGAPFALRARARDAVHRRRRPPTSPPRPRCSRTSRPIPPAGQRALRAASTTPRSSSARSRRGVLVAAFGACRRRSPPPAAAFATRRDPHSRADRAAIASLAGGRRRGAVRVRSPGVRVVARDRRLRLLVGVLSASTLVEGMVDVLVVVTALRPASTSAAPASAGSTRPGASAGSPAARSRWRSSRAAACASRCPPAAC